MEHITLFTDILPEEQERMRVCFHAREDDFPKWGDDYGICQFHE